MEKPGLSVYSGSQLTSILGHIMLLNLDLTSWITPQPVLMSFSPSYVHKPQVRDFFLKYKKCEMSIYLIDIGWEKNPCWAFLKFEKVESPFLGEERRFCLALLCSDFIPIYSSSQSRKDFSLVLEPCVISVEVVGNVSPGDEPPLSAVIFHLCGTESVVTLEAAVGVPVLAPSQVSPAVQDWVNSSCVAVQSSTLSITAAFVSAEQPDGNVRWAWSCLSGCAELMWKQSSS